jgi:hypothetical protein
MTVISPSISFGSELAAGASDLFGAHPANTPANNSTDSNGTKTLDNFIKRPLLLFEIRLSLN